MKLFRGVSLFLFVMVVGVVVEAQCLRCFAEPGRPIPVGGNCGYDFEIDWCDRDCCNADVGAPCRIPDFMDPLRLVGEQQAAGDADGPARGAA